MVLGAFRPRFPSMRLALLALLLSLLPVASASAATPRYEVTKRIPIAGDGFWDYLAFDSAGNRLFVSHQDRVVVVSAETGKELGVLSGMKGVHGIALAPDLGRGFISDGKANAVVVFDLPVAEAPPVGAGDRAEPGRDPLRAEAGARVDLQRPQPGRHRARRQDAEGRGHAAFGGQAGVRRRNPSGRVFANLEDTSQLVEMTSPSRAWSRPGTSSRATRPLGSRSMPVTGASSPSARTA